MFADSNGWPQAIPGNSTSQGEQNGANFSFVAPSTLE